MSIDTSIRTARDVIEDDPQRAYDLLREVLDDAALDAAHRLEATCTMGSALMRLGQFGAAEETFGAALDLEPANWKIASWRGENAMEWGDATSAPAEKMGHYQHAQNQFHRAIAMGGDTADLHYNLACMGAVLGDQDEAIRALRSAIARDATCRQDARVDPHLSKLRAVPEVQAVLADSRG